LYKLKAAEIYKEEVSSKNNLKIAQNEFWGNKTWQWTITKGGEPKKQKNQVFGEVRMANQKVKAKIRWKQIKRFVLKEFFTIVKSKNIRALIFKS
jgi:hypothetical protein